VFKIQDQDLMRCIEREYHEIARLLIHYIDLEMSQLGLGLMVRVRVNG